jgi:hypothetical protein
MTGGCPPGGLARGVFGAAGDGVEVGGGAGGLTAPDRPGVSAGAEASGPVPCSGLSVCTGCSADPGLVLAVGATPLSAVRGSGGIGPACGRPVVGTRARRRAPPPAPESPRGAGPSMIRCWRGRSGAGAAARAGGAAGVSDGARASVAEGSGAGGGGEGAPGSGAGAAPGGKPASPGPRR